MYFYRIATAILFLLLTHSVMPEPGGRGATGPPTPIFGRSVNPIPTGEGRLSPPITTGTPNVFHLPASLQSHIGSIVNDGRSETIFVPLFSENILIVFPSQYFAQSCYLKYLENGSMFIRSRSYPKARFLL